MRECMWESNTIYRPSHEFKLKTFNINKPDMVREDELVIENEYLTKDPTQVDRKNDLPEWGVQLASMVNVTPERLQLVSK
jgi:hypothetical protein